MLGFTLTALASLLFTVDPLGAVPAYLVMTQGDVPAKRRQTVLKASLAATGTLAAFATIGEALLRLFGLTLPAFQIAGGLILFLVGLDMIRAQRPTHEGPCEVTEGTEKDDVAITPLAIPMLAGPAALSTVVTMKSQAGDALEALIVYLAILLVGAVTYVVLRLAEPLHAWLGQTGIRILSRTLGLLLVAIAVQFVLDGLRAANVLPLRPN
jgi:multiple antibiotic resistance protein